MSATRCLSHCAHCGSHFHSDEGFDLHRGGSYADGSRICWPEEAEDRLEIATEQGVCDVGSATARIGVTIWRRKRPERSAGEVSAASQVDMVDQDREAA